MLLLTVISVHKVHILQRHQVVECVQVVECAARFTSSRHSDDTHSNPLRPLFETYIRREILRSGGTEFHLKSKLINIYNNEFLADFLFGILDLRPNLRNQHLYQHQPHRNKTKVLSNQRFCIASLVGKIVELFVEFSHFFAPTSIIFD